MSIKMSKENICINQIVGQKEESFLVEGDEIVPDIKPDVLNIISTNANVCIYKKELQDGKIKFEGSIYAYTLYIADDETASVRSINSSVDFSKVIEMNNINAEMQLESKCEIKSIDAKVLNGRKINIQANLKMSINVYSNENIEVMKDVEDISDIQKLNKVYNMNSLLGSGITRAYAKDTISIDEADNLSEVVKTKINISNKETKVSYNKILAKADANVKIVYLTEDNRINSVNATIPIMGFIDMQNVDETNICDVSYELKNISVKPNNIEEHSIYFEAEVEISCSVYENKEIQIIQDLYSPSIDLEYQQRSIKVMQNKRKITQTCNIRKQENIPEIGKNKIYDVEVKPTIISNQISNGLVEYEGEINLTFLFAINDNSTISSKTLIEPFSFSISDNNINANTKVETNISITTQDFIVMPDESIDTKIDLEFNLSISNMENINIISDVSQSENRSREKYSMVIYYTKNGDTLWNIAKRFGSTVEEILKINKLEDESKIMQGEQLFIPR